MSGRAKGARVRFPYLAGLHTFRRGDMVEYHGTLEKGESMTRAAVFGCVYAPPVPEDKQLRKILVLYDTTADVIFLGTWPLWRRVPLPAMLARSDFDCDNDEHGDPPSPHRTTWDPMCMRRRRLPTVGPHVSQSSRSPHSSARR